MASNSKTSFNDVCYALGLSKADPRAKKLHASLTSGMDLYLDPNKTGTEQLSHIGKVIKKAAAENPEILINLQNRNHRGTLAGWLCKEHSVMRYKYGYIKRNVKDEKRPGTDTGSPSQTARSSNSGAQIGSLTATPPRYDLRRNGAREHRVAPVTPSPRYRRSRAPTLTDSENMGQASQQARSSTSNDDPISSILDSMSPAALSWLRPSMREFGFDEVDILNVITQQDREMIKRVVNDFQKFHNQKQENERKISGIHVSLLVEALASGTESRSGERKLQR
ncbi:hypothetical protein CC2G_007129 [Coprinopsis cinerea AmutBmut pab1-1]|nr:hypothetical protein CC2G_007129 [Coprinopsis cinerea AmutBmut pab1-1]